MRGILPGVGLALAMICAAPMGWAQALPATAGETLSGRRVVLAEAAHGHATVLVAAFSHAGGTSASAWARAIRADSALAAATLYQVALLEPVPGFARHMIEGSIRKKLSAVEQDHFVVLTEDEKLWRSYFNVSTDNDAYVVLIDADGKMVWHGHGAASMEPLLRAALR